MSESRFFEPPSALTIGEIVALTGAQAREGTDLSHRVTGVAPLDMAASGDISYIDSGKYLAQLKSTRAGVCFVTERFEASVPPGIVALRSRDTHRDFTLVARKMYEGSLRPASLFGTVGIAPNAIVHASAKIDATATVDPGAMIGPRAEIGPGTVIGAGAVIGPQVRIGRDCSIGANTTVTHATIGDRVIIHPGCNIGQDGFGYVPSPKGHVKVPQIGGVTIHNDVEIGAGTAIDRGGLRDTVIGEGTKIDNLVQIGHNVAIGRHCVIVGQVGISGSCTIEDFVMMGGAAGLAPHVRIGKGARLAARSGVMSDIPAGQTYAGAPAIPHRQWLRQQVLLNRMEDGGKTVESPSISDAGDAIAAPAAAPTRTR